MLPLAKAVRNIGPDVVAVSGDLTQHATAKEFIEAREFLRMLPGVSIVVPGNHDLSFYNPVRRVWQRLALYKREITTDLEPFYSDNEISVLGLNTARVPLFRAGRFSSAQIRKVEHHMANARGLRVLVTHHPFTRMHPALNRLLGRIDLLLAGHMHASGSEPSAAEVQAEKDFAVFVQAGTALSMRRPGEPNSFNVIRVDQGTVAIEVWSASGGEFVPQPRVWFDLPASAGAPRTKIA